MKYFLSCDWGTSSFRLRLADTAIGEVVASLASAEGIAATFERWQNSEKAKNDRAGSYLDVIAKHIDELQKQTDADLCELTVFVSGMASSSIGIVELPYADLPFEINGSGLTTRLLPASQHFVHDVLIISGAKTSDDVMRGEETQLIGCVEADALIENALFIFPGTHSKHISIKNNQVVGIKTYMTGELFGLLTKNSILRNSVEAGEFDDDAFGQGLKDSQSKNVLHAVFQARINDLFHLFNKTSNYSYLSGLLIGAELDDLHSSGTNRFTLLCSGELERHYRTALTTLFPGRQPNTISGQQAEEAVVKGQLKIAKHLNLLP